MKKLFIVTLVALLWPSIPCVAQGSLNKEWAQYLKNLTTDLSSPTPYKPEDSMNALGDSRQFVVGNTLEILNLVLQEKKDMKAFNSSFNMVCRVVGEWRIEEATGLLLPYIDSTLDPASFGVGATFGRDAYYPAAAALVEIRSPDLNRKLLNLFASRVDDKKLQVITWMLQKSNGNDVAQFIVERELADDKQKSKNIGDTSSVRTDNLLKVLELLKAKDGVSLPPVEAPAKLTTDVQVGK